MRNLRPRSLGKPTIISCAPASYRHQSIPDQHAHLTAMMRGHHAYYGITGNFRRISWYARQVATIWQKWLSRRDRRGRFSKTRFSALLRRHPLPAARIVLAIRLKRVLHLHFARTIAWKPSSGRIQTDHAFRRSHEGINRSREVSRPNHLPRVSQMEPSRN
jgi:hypothetical protein